MVIAVPRQMRILLLLCTLLLPPFAGADKQKARVGVLEFQGTGLSGSEAAVIGELFTSELVASGAFDVVDRKNIEKLLGEQELQASGCTDSSCAVRIGQLLALDSMIYGSVSKLGESYVISVQLIDVGSARIIASAKEKFARIDDSYDVVRTVAARLSGAEGGATPVGRRFFVDLGGGFVIGSSEQGIEINLGARYVHPWRLPIGVGVGILGGLGFSPTGLRLGLDGYLYAKPFARLGLSIGFRGLPIYIGSSGGPTVGVHFDNLFVRAYFPVIAEYGFGIDACYTF
jgi:hypothetical protein